MIRLARRISFRLSPSDAESYQQVMQDLRIWNWTDLVRLALRRFKEAQQKPRPITLSDNRSAVGQADRVSDKRRSPGAGKGKKKAKVKGK